MISLYCLVNEDANYTSVIRDIIFKMNKVYGYVDSQAKKDFRRKCNADGRISSLDVIANNPTWKDIFSSLLIDYVHEGNNIEELLKPIENVSDSHSKTSISFDSDVIDVETVLKLASLKKDTTVNNWKTLNEIYYTMLPKNKWKDMEKEYMINHKTSACPKKRTLLTHYGLTPIFNKTVNRLIRQMQA